MTRVAVLLLALSLVLPASTQTTTIKIGAFLSLTGSTAAYGISAANAIKLATDEVNRDGGIDGKMTELVIEDWQRWLGFAQFDGWWKWAIRGRLFRKSLLGW